MSRYSQLIHIIDLIKPQSIVEIGTWNGNSAINMIKRAQKHRKNIAYIGYDLFEGASETTDAEELNVKDHYHVEDVEARIKKECPDARVNLIKGNTRQTLNYTSADLVFIDGGHSIETIKNDFDKCCSSKVIILDDFYVPDEIGNIPDTTLYGCNKLVSGLAGAIVLPLADRVKDGGFTQMVMVIGNA